MSEAEKPKTISDVLDQMAKECAAGVKTSCPKQPHDDAIPQAVQFAFGQAIAWAIGLAVLLGVVALVRRIRKR